MEYSSAFSSLQLLAAVHRIGQAGLQRRQVAGPRGGLGRPLAQRAPALVDLPLQHGGARPLGADAPDVEDDGQPQRGGARHQHQQPEELGVEQHSVRPAIARTEMVHAKAARTLRHCVAEITGFSQSMPQVEQDCVRFPESCRRAA
ncbi:hypothetical protein [Azospirillum sp.]|uniref:hypothetical protein n=1 Tax=Azospirillum sp. TaxID=34012 RepID=UPI002D413D9D|nr:hypothetical protein [Azospirillum sp.]HYD70552.1 hypothetical protein [Azospirillum sp.]